MKPTEEYVLQFGGPYDHDYFEVNGADGSIATSSYMTDIKHYSSLKLAELAIAAYRTRNRKGKIRIIRIAQEVVKVDEA